MSNLNSVRIPRTLTVGDSYSDGSAGIQADLKTFTGLSTFGMSVITALVARKTNAENAIHSISTEFISSQFNALVTDEKVDALKIGMLHSSSLIDCISSLITKTEIPIIVFDPVVITAQLSLNSRTTLRDQLLPKITLLTPTSDEAATLLDREIASFDDVKRAAQDLHRLGSKYVLIKTDHMSSQTIDGSDENNHAVDVLFDGVDFTLFKSPQLPMKTMYNTRCIMSAAITAFLAHGIDVKRAVQDAIAYTLFVAQNPWPSAQDNDILKHTFSSIVNQLPDKSLRDNQQKLVLEISNNVVLVKHHSWMEEPRIFPHQRSFVNLLKNVCTQEWFDYTHHQFLQNLGAGTLSHESFKHYLIQDYIFLTHFSRCYALAAYKSSSMAEIMFAAKTVCFIGHECEMHLSYCAEWEINSERLSSMKEARANLAYTRFTLDCGMSGDILDLYIALLPCLLGYGEAGLRLFNDPKCNHNSPYWKWITCYAAEDYQESCRSGEQLIERLAEEYGVWHATTRLKKLIDIFRTATNLEIGFWDMGLNIEW